MGMSLSYGYYRRKIKQEIRASNEVSFWWCAPIFLRPLAAGDAFVHSAPNPKQRSHALVDRLGPRATAARLRNRIPCGFMPVIVTTPWAS